MSFQDEVLRALDPYQAQTTREILGGTTSVRSALQRLRTRGDATCERTHDGTWLWWRVIPEVIRVDGDVLCEHCDKPYWRHKLSDLVLDYNGERFLHTGCDGNLLKT